MSITIPASELRQSGDVLVIAGQGFDINAYPDDEVRRMDVYVYLDAAQIGSLRLPFDLQVEVERSDPERSDPDAELVARIKAWEPECTEEGARNLLALLRETHDVTARADS